MFSKKNRIPRIVLEQIISQKECFFDDFFNLKIKENKENTKRFAVVVSKKIFKSSVKRHLIKRKFSSVIMNFFAKFPNKDYVFFLKKEIKDKPFKEIKNITESFINKNSL